MPLPSHLVYNDLSGDEIKHVLTERFGQLLSQVPYLQKHITLPRVKMTLTISLDAWADQPTPERQSITDAVEIESRSLAHQHYDLSTVVNSAPGGDPPDKVREEHNLPIPTPKRGQIAHEDHLEPPVDGRRMSMANGSIVDRTGSDAVLPGATVVIQDNGVAGLAKQQFNRSLEQPWGNQAQRDRGPVAPPKLPGR